MSERVEGNGPNVPRDQLDEVRDRIRAIIADMDRLIAGDDDE